MCTIYLYRQPTFDNKLMNFWSIDRIDDVDPEDLDLLRLEVAEYNIICGDISGDYSDKLQKYIDEWKKRGFVLIFNKKDKI